MCLTNSYLFQERRPRAALPFLQWVDVGGFQRPSAVLFWRSELTQISFLCLSSVSSWPTSRGARSTSLRWSGRRRVRLRLRVASFVRPAALEPSCSTTRKEARRRAASTQHLVTAGARRRSNPPIGRSDVFTFRASETRLEPERPLLYSWISSLQLHRKAQDGASCDQH